MKVPAWTDERIDQMIGGLLQVGTFVAGLVVLLGGILYLVQYGQSPAHYGSFHDKRAELPSMRSMISGVSRLEARAIIQIGLLLLIATPVARVGFSVVAFWLQRDRIYVPVTLVVLTILLYSLSGGGL